MLGYLWATLEDEMRRATSDNSLMYQVLDDVLAGVTNTTKGRGAVFAVIDGLPNNRADIEQVRRAESVSIYLHKLEWALQRRSNEDAEQARHGLKRIAVELLDSKIRTSTR